jgi:hypothetical protein
MFRLAMKMLSRKLEEGWLPRLTRDMTRYVSGKKGLLDAVTNIKHSWVKLLPGKVPHSKEGTNALRKLIEDEGIACDHVREASLPKGTRAWGISPTFGINDHVPVWVGDLPKTFSYEEIFSKIGRPNSKLVKFELTGSVRSCLSEDVMVKDTNLNLCLINLNFLKKTGQYIPSLVPKEEVSTVFHLKGN